MPLKLDDRAAAWCNSNAVWLSAREVMDEVTMVSAGIEQTWGVGRVRRLVGLELREKFDRQRALWLGAVWHGPLAEVQAQGRRMLNAWRAVDAAARALGASPASPEVWEVGLPSGKVLAVVRRSIDASCVCARYEGDGRAVVVYSLEEIAQLVEAAPMAFLTALKAEMPGAMVEGVKALGDPLKDLERSGDGRELDDPIPFG
jgi:hypothetical protein